VVVLYIISEWGNSTGCKICGISVFVDSNGLRYMVSVRVDSTGCTIYGVSVGEFN